MTNTNELISQLEARITELETQLAELSRPQEKKSRKKFDVLAILKEGPASTSEIAEKLEMSKNCVGTYLTYLRRDGYQIHSNNERQHYLA